MTRLATPPLRHPQAGQRGITLLGLLSWAVVVAAIALVVMRVVPTINEYVTIQRAVDKVAKEGGTTVPELRAAFDRQRQVEYAIVSITGNDLAITKENDKIVVSFSYAKEIELIAPVSLLIRYSGRSR